MASKDRVGDGTKTPSEINNNNNALFALITNGHIYIASDKKNYSNLNKIDKEDIEI